MAATTVPRAAWPSAMAINLSCTASVNTLRQIRTSSLILSSFPNPFNPTTQIAFTLPRAQRVRLVVYDVTGREVRTLTDRVYESGEHRVSFDGSSLPSGIYFARLNAGTFSKAEKLLLLK